MYDKSATLAHTQVHKAVRLGQLVPKERCELCDSRIGIVSHHWRGYEGDAAIDVWWICTQCNASLRGCHDGRLTLEQARDHIKSGLIPDDKRCKGTTIFGERCKAILVFGQEYCRKHDPVTPQCEAITKSGQRCTNSLWGKHKICSIHQRFSYHPCLD